MQDNLSILEAADTTLCPVFKFIVNVAQCFGQVLLQGVQVIVPQ
jgi:hypothetical protein